MRISLIGLHFAQLTARLGLSLAEGHAVEIHLADINARAELAQDLRRRVAGVADMHEHRRPTRKAALIDGYRLARGIERFQPDVVHAQEAAPWTMYAIRRLSRRRIPLVLSVHDPRPHSGDDMRAQARAAWPQRRLRIEADAIIVHGEALAAELLRMEPGLAGKVHSVPHGALGEAAPAIMPEQGAFLFFGRIHAYKGLGVLLAAVEQLAAQHISCQITIAGSGPDLARHRAQIDALPNVMLIERHVPAGEVDALFARHMAIVLPYLDATQSGVAAHAMSAGRPCIASAAGAITEVVRDGENGLTFAPGDATALAQAMRRLIEAPDLVRQLSRGACATARTQLSWDLVAQQTTEVYQSAIKRARRG